MNRRTAARVTSMRSPRRLWLVSITIARLRGVRAEVKREKSSGKGKELYNERYSGQAYRSFSLPSEIDSGNAKAAYDGGVLTLTLPKKAGSAVKHLSIG